MAATVRPARRQPGLLVFDGDCGFCTSSARAAQRLIPSVRTVPWQRADLDALGVRAEDAAASVQWVDSSGAVSAGAAAIAHMLLTGIVVLRVVGAVLLLPGVRRLAAAVYTVVAANRGRLPGATPACRVD